MSLVAQSCRDFYPGVAKAGSGKLWWNGNVSRETTSSSAEFNLVSRETDNNKMNEEILLPYTKFPENHIEDLLDIHPPQQPSQRMRRRTELFRREFLALPD